MENELKTDAKHLSPKEQYQLRCAVIRMTKQGYKNAEIAAALDVSIRMICQTKKDFKEKGIEGIALKKRGRRTGDKRILTSEQEVEIRNIIIDKTPEQLRFKCCLWNRKAIRDLIKRMYKIELPLSTLGYYLARWGFSVQRPIKRARKQDSEKVSQWLNGEYSAIVDKAKKEDAEIYWGDETALQNTANYVKGYAPIGQTPVVEVESVKMKLNLLSAVSNQGKLRFTILKKSINADSLIDFMRKLIKDSGRKIFLILDNLKVHHANKVKAWVEKHKNEIELFFLPAYAPENNPDEYLNSDLKQSMGNKPMPRSEDDIEFNARSFLKYVQLRPNRVKSYFKKKHTAYAAA